MTRPLLVAVALAAVACSSPEPPPPPVTTAPPATAAPALPDGHPAVGAPEAAAPAGTPEMPPGHPPVGAAAPAPVDPAQAVSGTVEPARALAAKAGAGKALYIVVRSRAGAIVAVRKEQLVAFPYAFTVSPADTGGMANVQAWDGSVDLTARVSITGDAMPGPGDIEGTVKGVRPGSRGVLILLDTVRP